MPHFEKGTGGIWVPSGTTQNPQPVQRSWQDVLYAVRGANLEQWNSSKQNPFKENYTVHRAISLIASNVAQVPLKFYKGTEPLQDTHELYTLFRRPNPYTSSFEFWELLTMYLYVNGEVCIYLNTNDYNRITDMYILNPGYMEHSTSKETGQIDGWVFNKKIPMTTEEVIFLKLPSDGLRGMSPLSTVLVDLLSEEEAAKFSASFFKNGAQLGGVLTTDKDAEITPEELKKIVDEFNNTHQGSSKAYKILGLLGGMQYKEIQASLKDMDFLTTRKDIRDKIMSLLGVNPAVMGIVENVNLANAQVAMRQFIELTILPQLIRIQQKLNATLFYIYFPDIKCKFDISSIKALKDDFNSLLEAAEKMLKMGYTRNEINERLQLNMPDTDDNKDLIPINLIERSSVGIGYSNNSDKQLDDISTKLEEKIQGVEDKSIAEYRQRYLKDQREMEKVFHSKVKTYFFKQRSKVLKLISDSRAIHNIVNGLDDIKDSENVRIKTLLRPHFVETAEVGERLALDTLGIKSVKKELIDQEAVENRVNKIVGINDTVFNQIKQEIYEAGNEGDSIPMIADRIRGVYNFAEKRSIIIARTETATLISETSFNVYKNNGVNTKRWISTKDEKTRETHRQNEQDGEIPLNGVFSGTKELYPGEVNCRCCVSPVIKI